ncbi:uncharacterized protein LOC135487279 isoform X1 [Lineus longissimus]|uniref:uncharacterized protein LOC135487279 isoform X1 n=1 Tax=Lineus longissimus TaxID=88925 RepID=UPI00315CA34A
MTWTWVFVCGVLMLVVIIPGAQGFFGMRKGDGDDIVGELWMLGDDPNNAIAGSTAVGVCNVTSPSITSQTDFNASNLVIKDFHGTPLPAESIVPISNTAARFTIKNISKSQYGKYKCYYKRELIYDRWIYVGELYFYGGDLAGIGTTVKGVCNASKCDSCNNKATSTSKTENSISDSLVIDHANGERINNTQKMSSNAIEFTIPKVHRSQSGRYICYYQPGVVAVLINTTTLLVGEKPMKPFLNLTNQDAVLVYNWENLTIIISPTIDQQNAYTHDRRETDKRLLTKCQIWFNWSVAVTGKRCSRSMPFTKCDMNTSTNTCKVPRKVYRDLSGRKPPNYTCIKAECWNDAFGNSSAVYRVDLAQRVRPAPVPSITAAIVNSRSVKSSWKPDKKWRMFGGKVFYDIEFNAKQFHHQLTFTKLSTTSLIVSDLIPHGEYNVQITASPKYAGFESDPTASTVIMPPDVPAENPQLIATDIEQYGGGEKKVTLFWKKIPEIKRNGDITIKVSVVIADTSGVQKRSLPVTDQLPADQIMYSYVLKDDKSYVIKLETMSTSLGRNTSLEPTTVQMERDHELSAPFVFVEAIRAQNDDYVNVTWEIPSEMDGEDVLIIYCEEGQDKECSKMSPLKTLTVPAAKRLVRVDNGNIYKIGLVRPTPGKPGLVKWSRCIYKQNEVPTVPPNLNLRPEPKKVQVQVDEYPCEVTLAKVVRVEGMLCRTSNKVTCSGESRSINISEGEFSQPHFYPVDHPGSHYMVQAQAVSSSGGRSPEWTDVFVATADHQTDVGVIVGVGVGCLVVLGLIVVAIIFAIRRHKKTKEAVKIKRTPAVKVDLHEDESDQCDQYAGLPRENPYESLLDQELRPVPRYPDHNETPPPLPARDMKLSNSSNTSWGAIGSSGVHSGTMATGEESGDEETGEMSSESAMDSSGCYAPGAVQIKISPNEMKKREIPMSVFKNDSACSEPSGSREDDISVPVDMKDDSSRGHPPCIIPDGAETEVNSRESFDANTSRDTDELGSASAVGSSRDYAQVALADQPPPSVLPAIQDDFAIDFAPDAHAGPTQGEKSTPENVVEEQVYRPCGPRGLLS